jgi:pimeloyl-ACP methyl ester carboxylesterase
LTIHRFRTAVGVIEFDEFAPVGPPHAVIVLVHGGGVTSEGYLRTPDGRPGWGPRLREAGFRVLVPTWPGLSRAGRWDGPGLAGEGIASGLAEFLASLGQPVVLVAHSMAGTFGYWIAGRRRDLISALIALAPAPPGDIQSVPKILGEDPERILVQGDVLTWEIPRTGWWIPEESFVRTKLIGSSTRFPSGYVRAFERQLAPIPAALLHERQNVRGSQLKIGAARFFDLPVLALTGSNDTDHPRHIDEATARFLSDRGAHVEFHYLTDANFVGNGHMLMLENNSDSIAELIASFIRTHVMAQRSGR